MNAHEQANVGGPLTPGNSGTGQTNGAPSRSFFISFVTAGQISGILSGDVSDTIIDIPSGALVAGIVHPIAFKRITSGTTAVGIMWWA